MIAFVGRFRENINVGSDFPIGLLRNFFLGAALCWLVVSLFLRTLFLSSKSKAFESTYLQRSNKPAYLLKYRGALCLVIGVSISTGIYGFLLFLLGDSFEILYLFTGLAGLALLFHRPKRDELIDFFHKQKSQ